MAEYVRLLIVKNQNEIVQHYKIHSPLKPQLIFGVHDEKFPEMTIKFPPVTAELPMILRYTRSKVSDQTDYLIASSWSTLRDNVSWWSVKIALDGLAMLLVILSLPIHFFL